ncbi:histone-lysine N-methyltransferase SUVR3-like isoform X2 [Hibiscus syriacus]|uniref:histone-lysine N-methyltransferase SUVR3-like isoform X2 n=1 Tax=Hibiscus syriacus TaxID=106335 RepID=UPI00192500F4|nr:histone-lysine N-methyltransferase SUVR3-like isoform X2 [Hibiscus syriacus]
MSLSPPKKSHERGFSHALFQCADLILPWLTPQELANVSLTCKTLHQIAHSITLHRSLDVSRSFENLPIPFHNTGDQHPYAYFIYTASQIILSSSPSLNRQFWGPNSSRSPVLPWSDSSGAEMGCARDSLIRPGASWVNMVDESGCECERCEKVSEDNVIGCACMELDGDEGMGIMSECRTSCGCGLECGNRLSQGGIRVKLKVVRDLRKGWGLYAAQWIQRGQFVCEYSVYQLIYALISRHHSFWFSLFSPVLFCSMLPIGNNLASLTMFVLHYSFLLSGCRDLLVLLLFLLAVQASLVFSPPYTQPS